MNKLKCLFRTVMVCGTMASAFVFIFQAEVWALISMMFGLSILLKEFERENK